MAHGRTRDRDISKILLIEAAQQDVEAETMQEVVGAVYSCEMEHDDHDKMNKVVEGKFKTTSEFNIKFFDLDVYDSAVELSNEDDTILTETWYGGEWNRVRGSLQ